MKVNTVSQSTHLVSVHALRGLASLWVCWFHFTNGNVHYPTWEPLRISGKFGWLGVEMFFVISGFILPFVLHKSKYTLARFKNFLVKRLVRLEPPYLFAIFLVIALQYASTLAPAYKGEPFDINFIQLFLHFGYLNTFFDYPWLNPVFWTLAIELQFYLILGVIFPIIMKGKLPKFIVFCLLAALTFLLPSNKFVFHYFFLFYMGYVAFEFFTELIVLRTFVPLIIIGFLGVLYTLGTPAGLAGLAATLFILFFHWDNRVLAFFGNISYSLYLVHVPVGGRVVNLFSRLELGPIGQIIVVLCAISLSVLMGFFLYKFVEKPSQQMASKIKYSDLSNKFFGEIKLPFGRNKISVNSMDN